MATVKNVKVNKGVFVNNGETYLYNTNSKTKNGYVWPENKTGIYLPVSNYVNTLLIPNTLSNNYKYEIEFKFNSILPSTSILGSRKDQDRGGNLYVGTNKLSLYIGSGIKHTLDSTLDLNRHKTSLEVFKDTAKCKWVYDNEVLFDSTFSGSVNSTEPWFLGGSNINGVYTEKSDITIYRFKVWDNSKIIMDLEPIKDSNSNLLFTNILDNSDFNII